jgi:hypothetical protein
METQQLKWQHLAPMSLTSNGSSQRLETGDIEEDLQIYLKLQVVELKEKFELLDAISEPTIQTILERAKS